jgi:hypothetical protein
MCVDIGMAILLTRTQDSCQHSRALTVQSWEQHAGSEPWHFPAIPLSGTAPIASELLSDDGHNWPIMMPARYLTLEIVDVMGACTDWTGYAGNNQPNCLITERLRCEVVQADLDRLFLAILKLTGPMPTCHSLSGETFRLANDCGAQMITALIRLSSQPSCKVETPLGKRRQLSMSMARPLQMHKQTK